MSVVDGDMDATQPAGDLWNGMCVSVSSDLGEMEEEQQEASKDQGAAILPEADEAVTNGAEQEDASAAGSRKRKKSLPPPPKSGDLRKLFASGAGSAPSRPYQAPMTVPAPAPAAVSAGSSSATSSGGDGGNAGGALAAFGLSISHWQEEGMQTDILAGMTVEAVDDIEASEAAVGRLEQSVFNVPASLAGPQEALPLLVAGVPLLPSGRAIFSQLPGQWIDFTGRSDALGLRCLFASRRHEHSVFEAIEPERLLRVPPAALEWQPALQMPDDALVHAQLAEQEPWVVQCHPARGQIRVLLRPGVLLMRMLRRGTALPSARFSWRVLDASGQSRAAAQTLSDVPAIAAPRPPTAEALGEFSILSNVEDAAHTQPPHFTEYPLRREQLRSLGWMVAQEKRRKDPFVTELREEAPCPDAPHWRLEGSLRCEYTDVRGGVLADAIGYGKTACTIGLVSCSANESIPTVPSAYKGMIPSRATLVLAPTNLHAQWIAEITKFTNTQLKVLSVPTCAQLKRLTPQEIMEADVVVATYRLFYSAPYLQRLQEITRERHPDFAFPRVGITTASKEWAKAYRKAFEMLPAWASALRGGSEDPITPARSSQRRKATDDVTPTEAARPSQASRSQRKRIKGSSEEASPAAHTKVPDAVDESQATQVYVGSSQSQEKRRRLTRKQAAASQPSSQSEEVAAAVAVSSARSSQAEPPAWATQAQYAPLEAFWWRRVVCDEFHELLGRYPPAQVAVELFHADYKWGLSGTPPCQTLAQIRKAACFFGVQIPSAASDDTAEVPRQVAQEWLDAFVRRNTAELPPLEEQERIVPVHLTPKERALYDALAQQHERNGDTLVGLADDGHCSLAPAQATSSSASSLLKLCSHFCYSGSADVVTAEDEVDRQVSLRRQEVHNVEKEAANLAEKAVALVGLVRHFEPHYCQKPEAKHYTFVAKGPKAGVVNRLKYLSASFDSAAKKPDLVERLFELLRAEEVDERAKEMALRADFELKTAGRASKLPPKKPPAWMALEARSKAATPSVSNDVVSTAVRSALAKAAGGTGAKNGPSARCVKVRSSLGMPKWPSRAADREGDGFAEFEHEDAQWRAEKANAESLRKVIDVWKADIERFSARLHELDADAEAKQGNYKSFVDTIEASQAVESSEPQIVEVAPSRFAKYGSKIETIVKHVQKVCVQDPGCKIICFVQWEDLKRKISSALQEFDVEHLTLQGSVWARRAALMKFQYEEDSPKMLLLSLQESASGTNLTAANHVIIVHPMDAATREEAVAFEMQAVGRVRRPGQQRKIHVWRFVTVGTIEQRITEEHQRDLWERQQSRILVSQPDACATQTLLQCDSDEEVMGQAQEPFPVSASDDMCTQAYVPAEVDEVPEDVEQTECQAPADPAMDSLLMPPPALPPVSKKPRREAPAEAQQEPDANMAEEEDATQPFAMEGVASSECTSSQTLQYEGCVADAGSDIPSAQSASDDMATQGY